MAEIYVTSTADSGAGSLRQAIADAQDGDVILFDADVFPVGQTTSILLSSYITINKSVSIYGGASDGQGGYTSGATKQYYVYRDVEGVKTKVYIDDETPALEGETLLFKNVCRITLDGQGTTRGFAISSSSAYNPTVDVAGIVFTDCQYLYYGGVMQIAYSSVVSLFDCNFVSCNANYGGALGIQGTSVNSINNCCFVSCQSTTDGGGISASNTSQVIFNDCIFDACHGKDGGCVRTTDSATININRCVVTGCSATANGGVLYSVGTSQTTLSGCQITGCSAGSCGAVYSSSTSQNTLNACTISGCSATNGGGVCSFSSSQNTLNSCTITNCSATTNGGGVYSANTSQNTLNDCTITDCSATSGGGVYSGSSSQNTLNACVIVGCNAANGGGVYSTSSVQNALTNCTITGCTATINGGGVYSGGTSQNTLNDCIFDTSSAVYVVNTSALTITGGITTIAVATLGTATITIADGAALSITTAATIGAATFTSEGRGYLAVGAGIDISSATLTGVVACTYGAGLESFSARETTRTEIKLDWTQTDDEIPVLVEQKVGDSWETVVESTAGTYNVTVEPATRHLFRAFDGVSFHVDAAWHGIEAPQFRVVGIIVEADAQDVNWQAITEVVNVDGAIRSGQSITILARIYDAYDNETVLLNETGNIVSVVYTLEKRSKSLFDYTWTPVEGHDEVEVSSECVLEDLQTSDAWTVDEDGYSFVLTPDTTEHTLFATPGVYRFRVKITLTEGNPVVFYEEINVVDE